MHEQVCVCNSCVLLAHLAMSQLLFLGDELMLDPLTLLDYPATQQSEEIYIRVDGPMEESAKE